MDKKLLIASIVDKLSAEMELIARAAMSAHDEATHPNEKQENQFDTPGLETSFLAEGQVKVAAEFREAADAFRGLEIRNFAPNEPIALGAVVDTELHGERTLFVVGPKAGGIEVTHEGLKILVITPQSPLGKRLIGKKAGDVLPADPVQGARPIAILSVA